MTVSFNGFHEKAATFSAASTVKRGMLVTVSANGAVAPCAANDLFCGAALSARDGSAAVQLEGYLCMPYTSDAPKVGYALLTAADSGTVKAVTEGGREYLVLHVDDVQKTVGFILK